MAIIQSELAAVEKKPVLDVSDSQNDGLTLTKACGDRLIALLNAMPNSVIRISDDVKGVVKTSLNVGVMSMDADKAEIRCLIRSLIDSCKWKGCCMRWDGWPAPPLLPRVAIPDRNRTPTRR